VVHNECFADEKETAWLERILAPHRAGVPAIVSYLRRLPREAPAGTRWHYSTGETNLVGILVGQATGKQLAEYLSEKIWVPAGMEQQTPGRWQPVGRQSGGGQRRLAQTNAVSGQRR